MCAIWSYVFNSVKLCLFRIQVEAKLAWVHIKKVAGRFFFQWIWLLAHDFIQVLHFGPLHIWVCQSSIKESHPQSSIEPSVSGLLLSCWGFVFFRFQLKTDAFLVVFDWLGEASAPFVTSPGSYSNEMWRSVSGQLQESVLFSGIVESWILTSVASLWSRRCAVLFLGASFGRLFLPPTPPPSAVCRTTFEGGGVGLPSSRVFGCHLRRSWS